MKTTLLIILVCLSSSLFAGPFDVFLTGLEKDYYFTRKERGLELNQHIRVAKFGALARVMNPDAIATYNGTTNVISLHEELLEEVGNKKIIKDARTIRRTDYSQSNRIATVFHEMGHAELDAFIENGRGADDQMISNHYSNVLKSFYKTQFPSFNPHTVFHEHFSYYRTDIIEFLTNEIDQVLMSNGYNKYKKTCFLTQNLRQKLADGISLDEFTKLFVIDTETFYRNKIGPRFIFVKGKDIDLLSPPNSLALINQTHLLFWAYHQKMYNFPANQTELIGRMNNESEFKKDLAACRTKIWNDSY